MKILITAGTNVRCSKLSTENEGLLPTGYWLEGVTFSDIEVSRPIKVVRHTRSRQDSEEPEIIKCAGMFTSSPVTEITQKGNGLVAKTLNSHWEITPV